MRAETPTAAAEIAAALGHGPAGHAERPRLGSRIDDSQHLPARLALVVRGLARDSQEVAVRLSLWCEAGLVIVRPDRGGSGGGSTRGRCCLTGELHEIHV